jgi:predicted DNA-binding transcriptional regulator AlpA
MDDDPLLLIDEVAKATRKSPATIRWLRHRGEGPPAFKLGRRLVWRRSGVIEWIAEQERAGTANGHPAA